MAEKTNEAYESNEKSYTEVNLTKSLTYNNSLQEL